MSTLLERMILRTRAPLSSLQPLAQPLYAPAAEAGPLPWHPRSDAMSADIAEAAAGPGRTIEHGQAVGSHAGWRPRERPPAGDLAAPALGVPDGDEVVVGKAEPAGTRAPSTSGSPRQPPASDQPDPSAEQPTPQPSPAVPTRFSPPPSAQAPPGELGPDGESQPAPAAPARQAAEAPIGTGVTPASGEWFSAESRPGPSEEQGAVSARILPASLAAPGAVGPPARQTPDVDTSPPEVTISIGHIEVRSAPATAPRPKPAFRPQVSLADFLAGRQDGRP